MKMNFNGKRILRILFCIFCLAFFSIWVIDKKLLFSSNPSPDIWCFDEELTEPVPPDILPEMSDILPNNRPPIFFIETSCNSRLAGKIVLNSRQACAVESAAKMNPNSDIYVLMVAATTLNVSGDSTNDRIIQSLLSYRNIFFRHISLPNYTKNTLLEKLYQSKVLHYSIYAQSHTSDFLRYLTLWKYGGTYLDLDVVVITQLEKIPQNYAGAEDDTDIAAGIINFDKDGMGHQLAEQCLLDLSSNYKPREWGANGPGVITRVLRRHCNADVTIKMTRENCKNFQVFPESAFYTINWKNWKAFFNETASEEIMKLLHKSKVIHVWNKFSHEKKITIGSKQPYGLIAEQFCPKVYEQSGSYF
ncbi:lactosylceramide 4-alpha-galactosyltransferase-like [Chrysoperla carnea]|uniref:lactosylceramide 4-alpha-galactosyltransferase-like n=1 Tax=Chrysoperla carnea TaxID=189513 RepID=UPI001D0889DA|nr:lactosylceramide 4-alpha-galactosyltransferase-like [Chrysoperla carnea]